MTTFVRCDVCGEEVVDTSYKTMHISGRTVVDSVANESALAVFHLHDACWDALVAWAGSQRTPAETPQVEEPAAEAPNG